MIKMTWIHRFIDILFHPIWMIFYFFWLMTWNCPSDFGYSHGIQSTPVLLRILIHTAILPGIAILMMAKLDLIPDLIMSTAKSRLIPLMALFIFYLWLYLNARNSQLFPRMVDCFLLGSIFIIALCFWISTMQKVSLHAAGVGGMIIGCMYFFYQSVLNGNAPLFHPGIVLGALCLIGGLVMTNRILSNEHQLREVLQGFGIGILGQCISIIIYSI